MTESRMPSAPGELIVNLEPMFLMVNSKYKGKICDVCLRPGEALSPCGSCGMMYYCDQNCEKEHHSVHSHECSQIKDQLEDATARMRIFVQHAVQARRLYRSIDNANEFVNMYTMATEKYPPVSFDGNIDQLAEFYMSHRINISPINHEPIAWGIYPPFMTVRNSCRPNCYHIFNGRSLEIRTAREIHSSERFTLRRTDLLIDNKVQFSQLPFRPCECIACADHDDVELREQAVQGNKDFREILDYRMVLLRNSINFKPYVDSVPPSSLIKDCRKILKALDLFDIVCHPLAAEAYMLTMLNVIICVSPQHTPDIFKFIKEAWEYFEMCGVAEQPHVHRMLRIFQQNLTN